MYTAPWGGTSLEKKDAVKTVIIKCQFYYLWLSFVLQTSMQHVVPGGKLKGQYLMMKNEH